MSFRRFTVLPSGIQQWKVFNWHYARAHPNGFFGVNGILHVWIKQPHLYNPVWIVVDYALCWSFFQIHTFKITAWSDPKITPFLHFRPSSNVVVETTTKENMCWPASSVAHSQQHLPHNIAAFPAFFWSRVLGLPLHVSDLGNGWKWHNMCLFVRPKVWTFTVFGWCLQAFQTFLDLDCWWFSKWRWNLFKILDLQMKWLCFRVEMLPPGFDPNQVEHPISGCQRSQ